jgi:hypothetical protein
LKCCSTLFFSFFFIFWYIIGPSPQHGVADQFLKDWYDARQPSYASEIKHVAAQDATKRSLHLPALQTPPEDLKSQDEVEVDSPKSSASRPPSPIIVWRPLARVKLAESIPPQLLPGYDPKLVLLSQQKAPQKKVLFASAVKT